MTDHPDLETLRRLRELECRVEDLAATVAAARCQCQEATR